MKFKVQPQKRERERETERAQSHTEVPEDTYYLHALHTLSFALHLQQPEHRLPQRALQDSSLSLLSRAPR